MARGNQRDLARAKAQKKAQEASKGTKDNTPLTEKRQRDADIMRQKQQAALEKKKE